MTSPVVTSLLLEMALAWATLVAASTGQNWPKGWGTGGTLLV